MKLKNRLLYSTEDRFFEPFSSKTNRDFRERVTMVYREYAFKNQLEGVDKVDSDIFQDQAFLTDPKLVELLSKVKLSAKQAY